MHQVYVSIGSNIEAEKNVRSCVNELENLFQSVEVSSVYQSKAIGFQGSLFLNLVAGFKTDLSLDFLNAQLKGLEDKHDRDRTQPKMSDRTLDIDILMFDALVGRQGKLTLPHPETTAYAFVLRPLAELAPDLVVPGTGKTSMEHWREKESFSKSIKALNFNWNLAS